MTWYSHSKPEERAVALRRLLSVGEGKSNAEWVFDKYCNSMTPNEMREFMKSEKGLHVALDGARGDEKKRRKIHLRIAERVAERALVRWQNAIAEARVMAEGLDVDDKRVITLAEKICVRDHYLPFHWNEFLDCAECGCVVVKDKSAPCPWCEAKKLTMNKGKHDDNTTGKERTKQTLHTSTEQRHTEELELVRRDKNRCGVLPSQQRRTGLLPSMDRRNGN